ncbi:MULTISPECIES: DegV family protein [unclassified Butyrivibrio]|uniref:DegV family protein n=1 Tax=unclassified Butyrivibrio TaxID=2639466 RepID=UPI0003B5A034|nr:MULTISPECIES: DegV family protein [unclassified Butyrivibrio]SDB65726.1 EDD domain protein, DegV family [Butyrivibrio sp. INlla16]
MGIRIITDSASDISQETAKEWGITVIPLKVRFGEEEFLDGVTMPYNKFYERLVESDELPKTSQIPPFEYGEEFRKAVEEGDNVICFTLSHAVSGCYQSACIAADEFEGKVHVVDTMQFCISQYIIVERAVRLRDAGMGFEELVSTIEEEKKKARVISVFDTLEYLKMGGRISSAAAFAGGVLSIKPVITIDNGVVNVVGKARGSRNGNNLLIQYINQHGGIDFDKPVCLAYTGLSDALLLKYKEDSKHIYQGDVDDIPIAHVGATIGTYAGPGAIACAYFHK